MSLFDFRKARELRYGDPSFTALIMAAMQKADTMNALRLKSAFPAIATELQARYDAPGGLLPGEEMPPESQGD